MDVLVYLADHATNVLPKERVIQDLWSFAFVTDEVLSMAIGELREALGDDAHNPTYIETIPRFAQDTVMRDLTVQIQLQKTTASPIASTRFSTVPVHSLRLQKNNGNISFLGFGRGVERHPWRQGRLQSGGSGTVERASHQFDGRVVAC